MMPGTKFQFTHPGRGATPIREYTYDAGDKVSIHAPREGCDRNRISNGISCTTFQFTHPGRGATGSPL